MCVPVVPFAEVNAEVKADHSLCMTNWGFAPNGGEKWREISTSVIHCARNWTGCSRDGDGVGSKALDHQARWNLHKIVFSSKYNAFPNKLPVLPFIWKSISSWYTLNPSYQNVSRKTYKSNYFITPSAKLLK